MSSSKVTRKFKRSGLHRLECVDCPGYTYSTVASLETVGLPVCACGGRLVPERLELALMLGVDSPVVAELFDRTESKDSSQMRSLGRRSVEFKQTMGTLNDMAAKAAAEIVAEQRQQARQRRLSALLPTPEPLAF